MQSTVSMFQIKSVNDPTDECLSKLLGQWVVVSEGKAIGTFKEKSEALAMYLRFGGESLC